MPFSSWFSSIKASSEPGHGDEDEEVYQPESMSPVDALDFGTIADRVEALQQELAYAYDLCEQANLQFDKYRIDVRELKETMAALQVVNEELQYQLGKEKDNSLRYQAQIERDQVMIKSQRMLVTQLQARLSTETSSLRAMTKHARTLEQRMVDTQFDLEYLKCTTNAEQRLINPPNIQNEDAPLPAQPFVVVLVDGDAYKWNPDLFLRSMHVANSTGAERTEPGGLAATRIRNEVIKYILKHTETIPITSKVITRVFCNYGYEGQFLGRQRAATTQVALRDFAVQFTEKMPLFDYFDAGRGKERADDKIRENFHLYLSTPNCHAIFVAACLDNGFARMLEQYSNHPLAYQKIVLVNPGHMAFEIQNLGFKQVMWSNVFATMAMSKPLAMKYEKGLQKQRSLKGFSPCLNWGANTARAAKGSADGRGSLDVASFLLERVPMWDLNESMAKYASGVGMRVPLRHDGDEVPTSPVMEHVELEEEVD
ncbi:hypothetical protein A1O1_02278 [Capronia coronata CBS 617.96]|uniref:DUF7923 domain-containing protein n=1 Tax=Capronia coronata CBS 617.96 TaxID=1182541 RepID=W9YW56_9EURO|nr:uncharacterized protein A1O1_02278 [Capronia coronata CBS 617.96]EXJ93885.1 hypothetical protein A1O1_02278 [Capronia coronata CBS 617.96]